MGFLQEQAFSKRNYGHKEMSYKVELKASTISMMLEGKMSKDILTE